MIIEEGADPVIQPPRRAPHGLQDRLKEKLDQMEHNRIVANTDEPTIWVKSLRLCLDPKDLNSVIRWEHFEIPTLGSLGGKKYFTVLDQKDSYWQVSLSEESCYLCTLSTPFGRSRFLHLPFRICSASEVLDKRGYKVYGDMQDMPGAEVIADDMIITGASGGAWSPVEKCDAKGKRTKCEVQSQKDPV